MATAINAQVIIFSFCEIKFLCIIIAICDLVHDVETIFSFDTCSCTKHLGIFSEIHSSNNLMTTKWTFPYVVYICIGLVLWHKPDKILKNGVLSFKGGQNKVFPVKNLAFKFFILTHSKFAISSKFSINHVL